MSSSKNLLTSIFSQLSKSNTTGTSLTTFSATDLIGSMLSTSDNQRSGQPRIGAGNELKPLGFSARDVPAGIKFGSPSSLGASAGSSSGEWGKVLKHSLSGGVASNITNGGGLSLLGSIGGLGGVFSGLSNLFGGGKTTLPALVPFQLPQSQQATISVGSNGASDYQSGNTSTVVTGTGQNTTSGIQYQSAQIAQAVKQALLNSSSLNDVIAEI